MLFQTDLLYITRTTTKTVTITDVFTTENEEVMELKRVIKVPLYFLALNI